MKVVTLYKHVSGILGYKFNGNLYAFNYTEIDPGLAYRVTKATHYLPETSAEGWKYLRKRYSFSE